LALLIYSKEIIYVGPFGKVMDWRQCAAVMQREEVTVNVTQ
jgi:hypothetical protein